MDADDSRLGCCCGEGENRDIARSLDRRRHLSLVLRTVARDSPGDDFTPLGDEVSQDPRVLIIDIQLLIGAESTYLPPDKRFFLPVCSGSFSRPVHSFLLSLRSLHPVAEPGRRVDYSTFRKLVAITSMRLRSLPSAVFHRRCWRRPSTKR